MSFQPVADPWSQTSSTSPVDPWQSPSAGATAMRPTGTASVESWLSRTQSPSAASGSSNEGWLHNNGSAPIGTNGNTILNMPATVDPWLSKSPPQPIDPWLNKAQPLVADPWQSPNTNLNGHQMISAPLADPWTGPTPTMGVCLSYCQ